MIKNILKPTIIFRIVLFGLIALVVASVASAYAAANTIAPSNVGLQSADINADDLKPAACAALHLTNVVSGSGTINGTSNNDLIIGSSGNDVIDGKGGDDCIIGAGGTDTINGGSGTDICVGDGGKDTFQNCETTIP